MKHQEFKPTPAMQIYAYKRGTIGEKVTDKELASSIGIAPETISRWKSVEGYAEWLEDQVAVHRAPMLSQLEMIARMNINNFNFWQALAQRYQFFISDFNKDRVKSY